jgi:ribosome biogenesis protein UTP30
MDDTDVLPEGAEEIKPISDSGSKSKKEKANVGKKRKSLDAKDGLEDDKGRTDEQRPAKKSKKGKLPQSSDDKLDKEIAERKANLKKQKEVAKMALED